MRFDYKNDAPLDFECSCFMPSERLIRHRDIYMGNDAAGLAVLTDGDNMPNDAKAIYKMSFYTLPRYKRKYYEKIKDLAASYHCHKMFFSSIAPTARLTENARETICRNFGSVEQFCFRFKESAAAKNHQGFLWLACDRGRGNLKIIFTEKNRLLPPMFSEILCLDLCEHSYCETFGDDRAAYAAAFLSAADFSRL